MRGGERWRDAGSDADARRSAGTHRGQLARAEDAGLARAVEPLAYTREQAAQALGVSLATLDRRVVPVIATVKTEWGARLIPAVELERYLTERTQEPRIRRRPARSGRKSTLPAEARSQVQILPPLSGPAFAGVFLCGAI